MQNIQSLKKSLLSYAKWSLFFLSASLCYGDELDYQKEKHFREQISYHLLIENNTEALKLARSAIEAFPKSLNMRKLYMEALSVLGSEKKLLRSWQQFSRDFPDMKYDDDLLEYMAKGILHYAEISEPYSSKHYRYAFADAFTDASSVQMLKDAFHDSNFAVREMALRAALSHGDKILCDEIVELLKREKLPSVRRQALEVLIRIKGEEAAPIAESILKDPNLSYMDRLAIILTLLDGKKEMPREELEKLSSSQQAIERLIAGYTFSYFNIQDHHDLLKKLITDPILDVKIQALTSLGHLRLSQIEGESVEVTLDPIVQGDNKELALLASWVGTLSNPKKYQPLLCDFIYSRDQKLRLQAASLIGYSLPYTEDLAKRFYQTHTDEYVRLNLSISLLVHRIDTDKASDEIFRFLEKPHQSVFKTSMPHPMETVWPSKIIDSFERQISGLSSADQNEVVHFCLLNLLAVLQDSRANRSISKFLESHHSNIALASIPQFIRAGSAPLLELICSFFEDPDLNKRIQAAALVAMLKKDEKALKVLYEAYPQVDRQLKETILSIVGQIGAKDSIPFLMDAVYEPSQTLRIIAASALMQCVRS